MFFSLASSLCAQSCLTLCGPMDCSPPVSSVEFFRQVYWSGLPFPTLGDLPDPGIKPVSLVSPALAGSSLPLALPGKSLVCHEILPCW